MIMNIIKFNSYSRDYNWLSNFFQQENLITLNIYNMKINFHSVESSFQALKLLHLNEFKSEKELIALFRHFSTLSNGLAKKSGNNLNLNRVAWGNNNLEYMEELIYRKFQDPILKNKLLSTQGSELIEFNTGSNFWGVNSGMQGHNHLGKIIMKIREHLFHVKQ